MRLTEQFFRILTPSDCVSCGNEGKLLCVWCSETALPEVDLRCYNCNRLTTDHSMCLGCKRRVRFSHLWVRTDYTESAKELVHAMKFKYSFEAGDIIARELANTIPALPPDTIIVHVPTITSHVRKRGFDHTKHIASRLSELTSLPHVGALSRLGQHRQVGSKRDSRLQQVEGVFRAKSHLAEGAKVLLVDDVITTGATVAAAAKELKQAGAKTVDVLVFAKAR